MVLVCVFHTVPLNISNSPKEKERGKKALIIFWKKSAPQKKQEGQVGLMLLTLVRFTGSVSLLSYLHGQ